MLRKKRTTIVFRREGTSQDHGKGGLAYGSSSTPDASDLSNLSYRVMPVVDPQISPIQGNYQEVEFVRGFFGNNKKYLTSKSVELSFKIPLTGAGSPVGSPPKFSPLMQTCGFLGETLTYKNVYARNVVRTGSSWNTIDLSLNSYIEAGDILVLQTQSREVQIPVTSVEIHSDFDRVFFASPQLESISANTLLTFRKDKTRKQIEYIDNNYIVLNDIENVMVGSKVESMLGNTLTDALTKNCTVTDIVQNDQITIATTESQLYQSNRKIFEDFDSKDPTKIKVEGSLGPLIVGMWLNDPDTHKDGPGAVISKITMDIGKTDLEFSQNIINKDTEYSKGKTLTFQYTTKTRAVSAIGDTIIHGQSTADQIIFPGMKPMGGQSENFYTMIGADRHENRSNPFIVTSVNSNGDIELNNPLTSVIAVNDIISFFPSAIKCNTSQLTKGLKMEYQDDRFMDESKEYRISEVAPSYYPDGVVLTRAFTSVLPDSSNHGSATTIHKNFRYKFNDDIVILSETLLTDADSLRFDLNYVGIRPKTEDQNYGTFFYFLDGIKHQMTGCRGDLTIDMNVGEIPMMNFNFKGLYVDPEDQDAPSSILGVNWIEPMPVTKTNTRVELDDKILNMSKLSISIGNQLQFRNYTETEDIIITDRKTSASITWESNHLSDKDWFKFIESAPCIFKVVHGKIGGNRVTITGRVTLSDLNYTEENGTYFFTGTLNFIPTTDGDDLLIEFS